MSVRCCNHHYAASLLLTVVMLIISSDIHDVLSSFGQLTTVVMFYMLTLHAIHNPSHKTNTLVKYLPQLCL